MELINALHLKVFWKDLSQKDFRDLAKRTPKIGCRTLDVMHVACAMQLEITSFVTSDDRQRKLAKLAGLPLA
ncbi:hypothetical protein OAE11_00815 [Akkermansiaceae bacterium]|nr:hypothetical protein [Akkermansiaceae bacterium]MDB4271506.1 hypothetical protein [Akkermansiaceae bacterium]MDB4279005.1 hypothetical protein [bacterium]MDB4283245.1 hypothetical protein [Akkermansiaceae bacterium]MDB4626766.1 hypothetical protein [Akkermansiaceae bacterium]